MRNKKILYLLIFSCMLIITSCTSNNTIKSNEIDSNQEPIENTTQVSSNSSEEIVITSTQEKFDSSEQATINTTQVIYDPNEKTATNSTPVICDTSDETTINTTQCTYNADNKYSYEQINKYYDQVIEILSVDNCGFTQMYIDERGFIFVGIIDESYRDIMEQKLNTVCENNDWYKIFVAEQPRPD